jgi:hypothetical protein
MKKQIRVTYKDLAEGQQVSGNNCPVALAIKRTVTDFHIEYLLVTSAVIEIKDERGRNHLIKTSPEVSEFIANFDCGRPVAPITFDLELPGGADFIISSVTLKTARKDLEDMAAALISRTLNWHKTAEGYTYWKEVHIKLLKYADQI